MNSSQSTKAGHVEEKATAENVRQSDTKNGVSIPCDLRDYFAAKAMQGELSSQDEDREWPDTQDGAEKLARYSYRVADAMLAAREKGA